METSWFWPVFFLDELQRLQSYLEENRMVTRREKQVSWYYQPFKDMGNISSWDFDASENDGMVMREIPVNLFTQLNR